MSEKINLERSNQDLESFAYMASHDLQEPLRTISNHLQLLKNRNDNSLDEKSTKYMNFSIQGAKNMKKLIDHLLEYSRVASTIHNPKRFDPKRIIGNVKRALTAHIARTDARIHIDELPNSIYADPDLIELVIQNLVQNALKYRNNDRSPQIHIKCTENNSYYTLSIKDNGPGIDPANHNKIFLGFRQFGPRKDTEGVGLGLAICKKIIQRHKGKIWVESELDKGSTFYATIKKQEV